jgi:hypothetical protein
MICKTRLHRGSNAQTRMNTAEIVVREVQSDSGFQVRQLLTEGIRQPRKSTHRHSHSQVLPLHKRSADMVRVRIALSNFRYNPRDAWWGVPRFGAIGIAHSRQTSSSVVRIQRPCRSTQARSRCDGLIRPSQAACDLQGACASPIGNLNASSETGNRCMTTMPFKTRTSPRRPRDWQIWLSMSFQAPVRYATAQQPPTNGIRKEWRVFHQAEETFSS